MFLLCLFVQAGICFAWTKCLKENYEHIEKKRNPPPAPPSDPNDPHPYRPKNDDYFAPGAFGMALIIFWGMYVLRIAADLCTEKRERIREGMRMMGSKNLLISQYILMFIQIND